MSNAQTMRKGLPKKYWTFRYMVSIAQILVVVFGLIAGTNWLMSNGNGARIWNSYYSFSQGASDWSHTALRMPWEPGDSSGTSAPIYEEEEYVAVEPALGLCGDGLSVRFEGQTENFSVSLCTDDEGNVTYVGGNESQGWVDLPAMLWGGAWEADQGDVTYEVTDSSLTVRDNASGTPILTEDMIYSETF